MADWFTKQFGVSEQSYDAVHKNFAYDHESGELKCLANGRTWAAGHFSTPSLGELRARNAQYLMNPLLEGVAVARATDTDMDEAEGGDLSPSMKR